MNIFQTVKENVTARQAAEQYGLKVNKNGMICCPFHDDRHPSMKVDNLRSFICDHYFSPPFSLEYIIIRKSGVIV